MEPDLLLKPDVSEQLAVDLSLRLYGLKVMEIKRMVSFDDQNFHIKVAREHHNPYLSQLCEDGYTLKITNTSKSSMPAHFDSMHSMMLHLDKKGLKTPVPVPNLDGNTWKLEEVPLKNKGEDTQTPKRCGIHLLTFIPGVPISQLDYTEDLLYQWGQLLAKFHNALEDFDCPELLNKKIFWSLEYVPQIEMYMEGLEECRKKLVMSVLNKYLPEIKQNWNELPKGVIHGDFNQNNILVQMGKDTEERTTLSVDGILDYEDMHYGTYAWEIGLMLAYMLLDCKTMDPLNGAGHTLAGYLSLRSLSHLEISLLKMCIQCRLSQSLVLGADSYRSDPGNTYLLTTAKTGWNRLEKICSISNEDLLSRWKKIQQSYNFNNNI